jgi:hypothetical protein
MIVLRQSSIGIMFFLCLCSCMEVLDMVSDDSLPMMEQARLKRTKKLKQNRS